MNTKIYQVTEQDTMLLEAAGQILRSGGLVAFPTETVYGLGANGLDGQAVKKIFAAKGRPSDNPLILHIAEISGAEKIGVINPCAARLMQAFWPGPLTVIVRKKDCVPDEVTAGLDTVAIRLPSQKVARALICAAGVPVAAPSANLSGKPSPTAPEHVIQDLDGKVDMILDGGSANIGIESTVIDTTGVFPVILRPGGVTLEMVRSIFPQAQAEQHKKEGSADYRPKSPGMKYKHYAPKAKVIVFERNAEEKINRELHRCSEQGLKAGVFCRSSSSYSADHIIRWGDTSAQMAACLFGALREFDGYEVDEILCEAPEKEGVGEGVRNRLYKAAGFDIR